MIQNFQTRGGPEYGRKNLPKLRDTLKKLKLDGFLVPHEDEYQNEYLPECNERLMWVSGFTGSAGAAIIMQNSAAIFVDGRYTLQVKSQVDNKLFSYEKLENDGLKSWLEANTKATHIIGYDPKLHTPNALKKLKKYSKAKLMAIHNNPLDNSWENRPEKPTSKITIHPIEHAGESHHHKCIRIAKLISNKHADVALITSPSSIAWLLNIRGADVMCTPLILSTAIIDKKGKVQLFVDSNKLTTDIKNYLGKNVVVYDETSIENELKLLKGSKVLLDPSTASSWFFDTLSDSKAIIIETQDPISLPKACKNTTEIQSTINAHKRDAVPLIRFLHWLDTQAQSGKETEISAAKKLEEFRHETTLLKDLSFESISGAGSNGAIVHYRVSEETSKTLSPGTLYLIDSGAQYEDGTTDVTRTVPIGKPSAEMRHRFTLVLKGHIALATAYFPEGTTGSNLDALARMPLWQNGLDYDHGTGHGVGLYLGVHEGPQRISKVPNDVALEPGMILSNEPGYYKKGAYGIRIENLQYVTKPISNINGERKMLSFKTLTLAPIHSSLIDKTILNEQEKAYINKYHKTVYDKISPSLSGSTLIWLQEACKVI